MSDLEQDYKEWVREQKCAVCMASPPNDPHHLDSGIMGSKKSHLTCIPLCRECHRLYHDRGHKTFAEDRNVDLWRQAHRHLRRYISKHHE